MKTIPQIAAPDTRNSPAGHFHPAQTASGASGNALEQLGTQVARLAHDLNNLLTPALLMLDMACGKLGDSTHRRMLDVSKRSLLRAADMTSELVAFASGRQARRGLINPRSVAEEVFAFARETFPSTISVQMEIEDHSGFVIASGAELHRALLNLCTNARDAMPDGGELRLRVASASEPSRGSADRGEDHVPYVLIEVSDTGGGIPVSLREKIFDPFFTTKGPGKGSGLGLASVKAMIESHGGCLSLQTEIGRGTTFRIFLPIV
jgi:signal transduction histidine kinase